MAGKSFWSDRPDVVIGTRETAALIATESGKRVLSLPTAMTSVTGGEGGGFMLWILTTASCASLQPGDGSSGGLRKRAMRVFSTLRSATREN